VKFIYDMYIYIRRYIYIYIYIYIRKPYIYQVSVKIFTLNRVCLSKFDNVSNLIFDIFIFPDNDGAALISAR